MTKTFTKNDLILFIYNEIQQDYKSEMHLALSIDPLMAEDYHDLKEAQLSLPRVSFKPSSRSIRKIREYMSSMI